ncbi:MAG TPA: sulfatase-like hydrolase/transferase [Actinokineospora sp.]|nr:sulfatase-like hydrolase/transferase [Actinokineospora sp.]
MQPSRRQFLIGSAVAIGGAALPSGFAEAATSPPNFVVILADDLGYGELGAYGQQLMTTPVIDGLAAAGLRFTSAYASAAVCAPSRCSLLTGLHSGHATVRQNPEGGPQGSLNDTDVTFAELLRTRGYRTACIGKWGFGPEQDGQPSHPNARGFEEFFGYITHDHAHDYYPDYLWNNGVRTALPENSGTNKVTFAPDLFRDRSVEFINAHKTEPFLLFFTPNLPHAPSDVPSLGAYATKPWPAADKGHAAQVSRLDSYVGSIVDTLRANSLAENTIVIVTSDNGPHEENGFNPDLFDANGPLRGYKRNLYEGGIRIPLIAWSPGLVQAGTSDRPTQQTDLLPTLSALAGAPVPSDIDGVSAAPLLSGQPSARADHLYWYRREPGSTSRANLADGGSVTRVAEAVRESDWKALRFAPGHNRPATEAEWKVELYNLKTDIGEATDVAAQNPVVAARLVQYMRDEWVPQFTRPGFGLTLQVPATVAPGGKYQVTATLANGSTGEWTAPQVTLTGSSGWTVRATSPTTAVRLTAGQSLRTTFEVTVPATPVAWQLTATATTGSSAGPLSFTRKHVFVPPAPTTDSYLSDLRWVSATNGWGPVELDKSNGKSGAGDGTPISFGGTVYQKGLGVHAPSEIVYYLGAKMSRFTAVVGIDDFSARQSTAGSVVAEVWADGRKIADTGLLTAAVGPKSLSLDVVGVRYLSLIVRNAANTTSAYDHTSWANARVTLT